MIIGFEKCSVLQHIYHQLFPCPREFQRPFTKGTNCQDAGECIDKTINNVNSVLGVSLTHMVMWQAFFPYFIEEDTIQNAYTACPRPHSERGTQSWFRLPLPWPWTYLLFHNFPRPPAQVRGRKEQLPAWQWTDLRPACAFRLSGTRAVAQESHGRPRSGSRFLRHWRGQSIEQLLFRSRFCFLVMIFLMEV